VDDEVVVERVGSRGEREEAAWEAEQRRRGGGWQQRRRRRHGSRSRHVLCVCGARRYRWGKPHAAAQPLDLQGTAQMVATGGSSLGRSQERDAAKSEMICAVF
jgi:hypothetical protein